MNPVRALYCSVCGSFGVLLFAPTALTQADITKGSIGTNPVETSSVDTSAIDEVDECMVAQICIDRYLWSRYERTRKIDTIKVSEQTKVTVKRKGKTRIVTKTITKLVDGKREQVTKDVPCRHKNHGFWAHYNHGPRYIDKGYARHYPHRIAVLDHALAQVMNVPAPELTSGAITIQDPGKRARTADRPMEPRYKKLCDQILTSHATCSAVALN